MAFFPSSLHFPPRFSPVRSITTFKRPHVLVLYPMTSLRLKQCDVAHMYYTYAPRLCTVLEHEDAMGLNHG